MGRRKVAGLIKAVLPIIKPFNLKSNLIQLSELKKKSTNDGIEWNRFLQQLAQELFCLGNGVPRGPEAIG